MIATIESPYKVEHKWEQLRYHEKQAQLWRCKKRTVYVPAGRASGKTEISCRRLVRYLPIRKQHPDPIYVFAGPTYAQAKRIAWRKLLGLLPMGWMKDVSLTEMRIETIFGSVLLLIGLDKPERIEGIQVDGIVVDENSDVKPGVIDRSVLPTLTWRKGWLWRIGVPKRFGVGAVEFRTRYMKAAANEVKDEAGFTWPSSEIVPPENLAYFKSVMNSRDYSEQFDANWQTASGGIFHSFDTEYNVRPCAYKPDIPIMVASDFNVNPMCWTLCHRNGHTIEVFDELFIRDANTRGTLDILFNKYRHHKGGFQFYGDATGKARKTAANASDYQQIMNDPRFVTLGRTVHYLNSNPPKADRFAVTNNRLCDGMGTRHVFIDASCNHLISDFEIRSFKPGSSEPDDSGDIGHPSDGLGYLLNRLFPLTTAITTSTPIVIIKQGTP